MLFEFNEPSPSSPVLAISFKTQLYLIPRFPFKQQPYRLLNSLVSFFAYPNEALFSFLLAFS